MALSPANKEKMESMKKRIRTLGVAASKGWKMTAVELVGGGGTYYALGALQERVEFLQSHWYVTPAVLVAGGHFLKRKSPQLGAGLVFLGGFLAAQGYDQSSSDESTSAEGYDRAGDAGAWGMLDGGEAGAMVNQPLMPNMVHSALPMQAAQGVPTSQAAAMVGAGEAMGLSD